MGPYSLRGDERKTQLLNGGSMAQVESSGASSTGEIATPGLIGRINYYAATFLFVLAFLLLFQYRQSQTDQTLGKLLALSMLQAVLTAGAVGAVFRYLFLVELP